MTLEPCRCGRRAAYHPYGLGWFVQCTRCNRYGDDAVFGTTKSEAKETWNRHQRLVRLADDRVKDWAEGKPVEVFSFEYVANGVIVRGGAKHHPGYHFKLVVEDK